MNDVIDRHRLQRFKDNLTVGDFVIISEPDVRDNSIMQKKVYHITEKHRHVFTAQRRNKRGQVVTVSMAYAKLMVEGSAAVAREFR